VRVLDSGVGGAHIRPVCRSARGCASHPSGVHGAAGVKVGTKAADSVSDMLAIPARFCTTRGHRVEYRIWAAHLVMNGPVRHMQAWYSGGGNRGCFPYHST
jgi:hypothetical protein